jgi:hypothetical protein
MAAPPPKTLHNPKAEREVALRAKRQAKARKKAAREIAKSMLPTRGK